MASAWDKIRPLRSSLPYQVLLYFNSWYFILFFLLELSAFIWKAVILPYPAATLASEIVLLFILAGIAILMLYNGAKGNVTERVIGVCISLLLTVPAAFGAIYLLIWQTYVLYFEVVIISIQLAFLGLEIIFAIISFITFSRAAS